MPNEGYVLSHLVVKHGYNLNREQYVKGNKQYDIENVPGYMVRNDKLILPENWMDGDVIIEPYFRVMDAQGPYATNFDKTTLLNTHTTRQLNSFTLKGTKSGNVTVTVPHNSPNTVYRDLTSLQVSAMAGETMNVDVNYTGDWMHLYLYVDYNNDGFYDAVLNANGTPDGFKELVSYTYYNGHNSTGASISYNNPVIPVNGVDVMPSFTLPADLPNGMYRARLKVDWDNINAGGSGDDIGRAGGSVVDFLLNVHSAQHRVHVNTSNGSLVGVPYQTKLYTSFALKPLAAADGYVPGPVKIKHGHNLDGPQYIMGNRQWNIETIPLAVNTPYAVPAQWVDGDILVSCHFTDNGSAYKLVFHDEFDGPNGSTPNPDIWRVSPRGNSQWNRFISTDKRVYYLNDGNLVTRAMRSPTNPDSMITGAVESSGKYSFKYGRIEARIYTNKHWGNFPAFWMMPDDQSRGWPNCGEIDIWEQINEEDWAYQNIHTEYRYKHLTHSYPVKNSARVTMDRYHTFGLEWTETELKWFIDGEQVFRSYRINEPQYWEEQWPFNKPFYIMLNQSVGRGDIGWAGKPDFNYVYETLFDWVRVYQKDVPLTEDVVLKTTTKPIKNGGIKVGNKVYTHFKNYSSVNDMQLPDTQDGLAIFIATAINDDKVVLTRVEDNVIPANTGVILAYEGGTVKEPKTVSLKRIFGPIAPETLDAVKSKYTDNLLVAVTKEQTDVPLDGRRHFGYYLHANEDVLSLGFYKPDNTYTTLRAGTSFLREDGSHVKGWLFIDDNVVTNLVLPQTDEVKDSKSTPYYNIGGEILTQPHTSGVYIHNGKKIIIRK